MYPATPSQCPNGQNVYNPTIIPWYVAASSGPKDVILVLDTSGSMRDYDRIVSKKNISRRLFHGMIEFHYFFQ